MNERYDAIVVGAGHNGLVCASLLAKAGKKILVLEANDQVGGAAITRTFADGYSVSACAHLLYQLQPQVRKDLGLKLELSSDRIGTISLSANGDHVRYNGNEVSGTSDEDAASYKDFYRRMTRFADLLQTYFNKTPPRLAKDASFSDMLTLAQLGFDVRRLGKIEMQEFLRLIGINIYDELVERFESGLLKGALSLDAVLGTHLGPRSPNTILTYLYRLTGSHGTLSAPAGGMGAVSDALAHSARDNGATIRTGIPVKKIIIENGRAAGVETENGEIFSSGLVVSNADPKSTIMRLVSARNVETGFTRRVGETSARPVFEITFPSFRDASLAPTGKHVMSAIVQYAPYELREGWSDATRETFLNLAIETLGETMPDLKQRINAAEMLTPADIEKQFLITGGHWHHGELTLDQFLFTRPVGGAAQYAMPLDGLYLCGAGAHPGGGVSGAAGRNAARMILKREKAA